MALLLVLAYAVGGAIRFNIRHFEPIENAGHGPAQTIALISRIVLGGAYFISVTYYLQLLSAFLTNAAGIDDTGARHRDQRSAGVHLRHRHVARTGNVGATSKSTQSR